MYRILTSAMFALLACIPIASAQPVSTTLRVNGRAFSFAPETLVVIDEKVATFGDLAQRSDGMHVVWHAATAGLAAPGGAPALVFSYTLIGPVTSTNPFAVLGQPLTTTANTTLAGFTVPAQLPIGTSLATAGLLDANGSLMATLIERLDAPPNKFLLAGMVQEVGVGTLRVGEQSVDTTGLAFQGCNAAEPIVGDFVELRATPVNPFPPGTTLTTVFDARCVSPVPPGTIGATGFVQALITAQPDAAHVQLGPLQVEIDAQTTFVFGARDDLDLGVGIAVDGTYTAAQAFHADVVEFVRPVVRFIAPVAPADVVPGESLRIMGVSVQNSAQVRDEDGILANGLAQAIQAEVRGYLDSAGNAYTTRVRQRGAPDLGDTRLRGPVQSIASPLITVLGIAIDTTAAAIVDHDGLPMTSAEFFAAVLVDHLIDVSDALYDPVMRRLRPASIVFIGAEPVPPPPRAAFGGDTIRSGTASAYAPSEIVFNNGFE
ncbi:MAG: DUF5666 domain-containing protein [Lysobacterales bacterium]